MKVWKPRLQAGLFMFKTFTIGNYKQLEKGAVLANDRLVKTAPFYIRFKPACMSKRSMMKGSDLYRTYAGRSAFRSCIRWSHNIDMRCCLCRGLHLYRIHCHCIRSLNYIRIPYCSHSHLNCRIHILCCIHNLCCSRSCLNYHIRSLCCSCIRSRWNCRSRSPSYSPSYSPSCILCYSRSRSFACCRSRSLLPELNLKASGRLCLSSVFRSSNHWPQSRDNLLPLGRMHCTDPGRRKAYILLLRRC